RVGECRASGEFLGPLERRRVVIGPESLQIRVSIGVPGRRPGLLRILGTCLRVLFLCFGGNGHCRQAEYDAQTSSVHRSLPMDLVYVRTGVGNWPSADAIES